MVRPAVDLPGFSMVTRSEQNRLDAQEEQIQKLQADMAEIKSALQSMESEKEEQAAFRQFVMNWVKHQDKRPGNEVGDESGLFEREADSGFVSHPKMNSPFVSERDRLSPEPLQWAAKKVKLPEFSGLDPQGWIKKAELYFEIHGIAPQLRIRLAQLSMVGVAQHWFSIVNEIYAPLTWDQFTKELLQRFSGLEIQNPYEQLATLQQVNSIHEYIEDFEYLLSLIPRLPESQALGYFIAGLRDEVKCWVRLHRPQSRLDAKYLAKDVEQMLCPSPINSPQSRFRYQNTDSRYGSSVRVDSQFPLGRSDTKISVSNGLSDKGPISRFTLSGQRTNAQKGN